MTKTIAELLQDLDDDTDALGQLMATNLNTMGVTSASASDGLTTLAGKILQVPSGGGQTLTLTTDNPIISYYDSETTTLIAVLGGSDNTGKTITFYKGTTSIGTATTDNNGIATYTYTSNNEGELTFKATYSTLTSNTITIEDIYLYDSLRFNKHKWKNTNHTSNYTFSTNGMTVSTNSNGAVLSIDETLPSTYTVEVEVTGLTSTNQNTAKGGGIGIWNTYIQPMLSSSYIMNINNGNWFEVQNKTYSVGDTLKLVFDGTKVEYYNGSTKIGEINKSGTDTGFGIRNLASASVSTTITLKNLRIIDTST